MLGKIIKEYLDMKGLIQSKIARKAGMKISTFNDILNGRRKIETSEYFNICKALEVSVDFFEKKLNELTN
jgi:transcriptional regulator with XRE-family HTH domain